MTREPVTLYANLGVGDLDVLAERRPVSCRRRIGILELEPPALEFSPTVAIAAPEATVVRFYNRPTGGQLVATAHPERTAAGAYRVTPGILVDALPSAPNLLV